MVGVVPGRLKILGSKSLLWSDVLLRRGLPRLVPVFLGMSPLLPVISSWGRGLLCWTFLPWLFYCSIWPLLPCVWSFASQLPLWLHQLDLSCYEALASSSGLQKFWLEGLLVSLPLVWQLQCQMSVWIVFLLLELLWSFYLPKGHLVVLQTMPPFAPSKWVLIILSRLLFVAFVWPLA